MNKNNAFNKMTPKLRFPDFQNSSPWGAELGGNVFDQISNKNHDSDLPILAVTQEFGAIPRDLIGYHVSVAQSSIEGYKIVDKGDFIISLRSFQGGIEFSKYRGICSPAYIILRLKSGYSAEYFRHYLKSERFICQMTKNLEGMRDGKMISYKQFSELELAIPSLAEQECIANCLTSLDELISEEVKRFEALSSQKHGLMQELFPRDEEPPPRLRGPNFKGASPWVKSSLTIFFNQIRNGFVGTASPYYVNQGVSYLQGKNIKKGRIDSSGDLVKISESFHNLQKKSQLQSNDILMVQSGHVGECAVVGDDFSGSNCHALIILSPREKVDSRFFVYYFYSQIGLSTISRITTGNTIKHILASDLQVMEVMAPTFDEQRYIADCLSALDDQIVAQSQKIDLLRLQKQGLVQQLFPMLQEAVHQ